ncbi:MAG: flavodoxin [Clostridia bacterium]|nr:flavodoxin [Clostridia bacterium]
MKIGLLVHSVTGNTLSVMKKLQTVLAEKGHEVELKEIKTAAKVDVGQKEADFTQNPSPVGYDAVVFGSHTEAFQLEAAMKLYFRQMDRIEGVKTACVSTHQFPFKWLGGNSAVRKMREMCEEKGAEVVGTAVIDWSPESKRQGKIDDSVSYIAGLF